MTVKNFMTKRSTFVFWDVFGDSLLLSFWHIFYVARCTDTESGVGVDACRLPPWPMTKRAQKGSPHMILYSHIIERRSKLHRNIQDQWYLWGALLHMIISSQYFPPHHLLLVRFQSFYVSRFSFSYQKTYHWLNNNSILCNDRFRFKWQK